MSNLPIEANEEDLIKSLQGVAIEQIGILDQVGYVRVKAKKDVLEALTFDQKYLYYKEVQVRRAHPDTVIPQSLKTNQRPPEKFPVRLRGLPFEVSADQVY